MSVKFVVVVAALALLVVLVAKPKLRRLLRERIARQLAPLAVRLLGPLSPKAFVSVFIRAAKAGATETHTGSVLPNHVVAGVSPVEYDSWGPLCDEVGHHAERALRDLAAGDDTFILLGRPTVIVKRDPLAKPRRPRFVMSVLDAGELDSTTHRPSRTRSEDPTPIMPRRRAAPLDPTGPLAEVEVLIDDRPNARVELGEGRHLVGRDPSCAVVINEESVSRHAAVLMVTRQCTTAQDAGSLNGVYVGRAKAEVPLLLADGDVITLSGTVKLRVLRAGAQRKAS